ncbi:C2 and GRAM domain-containing protein At5g50170 isoform X2 [Cynara cardunculus var. scolymus]|uniref:C2 and GRAM domain-containing protein At5g50170 isoform X2 n=1 Tax=Cynara cardunculus var. scolymus TaxID=59895 RepID=UPI000D62757E|nr:C2 and GRAM domain-containing protein At5g50170 isoform X2 [Cynara cardunculus var. scolymus]
MRLYVYVLEGKNWEVDESFVKLRVGKSKSRTRVLKNTKTPIWNEEFAFRVHSLDDQLTVSVHHHHHHEGIGFLKNGSRNLVGRVRIPLWSVAAEENHHLPPTWFSIETHKSKKSINQECGKILVALSLHGRGQDVSNDYPFDLQSNITDNSNDECDSKHSPSHDSNSSKSPRKMMKSIVEKLFSKHDDSAMNSSDNGESTEEPAFTTSFEDSMETMESTDEGRETPENLQGGVLIDETYVIPPKDLNHFIFAPDSQFRKDLAAIQGTTDVHEGPWTWESDKMSSLTRTVTYTKAASKLVKASKVTEEQTYVRASGIEYAVFVRVNTPDVPYGNTFRVELLYKITRVPELGGDETSRIIVSWRVHFNQSTMMKGMIEGGAKQGLKESFDQFSALLAERFKLANPSAGLDKDHALASLQNEHQSDWELAVEYFCNFMVISTVFMVLYTVVHILLCEPPRIQGLEFNGLELPDSFGELVTCGIIFFNLERVSIMVSHFVQARLRRGNDHGVKAQGEGWVLTVALIEGTNLAPLDSSGFSDPYVVLTCNGKTRTSSVKLQTLDPRWNEILEFDASEEPPSLLDVEVFDFDGPFGQPTSLGHSEIRFLRHTAAELADMWVPLDGKLAQSFQSKLHLRIFLDNTNGVETIKEYLTKVEKEAGKKLHVKSPHRNSTFQKLFSLPPEEFLINDFSCSLKRKLPLQGRLFVSSRIVGFYANFFGHKTKFSFLWEDVEDIQVLPPSLASVGSPILVMVLHKDRGVDARHGAKSQDEQGRHRFYFHSFVSFNSARRTIMALWRTRMLSGYQKTDDDFEDQHEQDKADDFEDQHEHDEKGLQEDVASHLVFEDAKMSKIYSVELPFSVESTMEIFKGGNLEQKVMGKLGCLNYNTTNWEPVYDRSNVAERRLCYKLNRRVSSFGGDVMCTQQKTPIVDGKGWIVTEAMCLRDVPFGDHFYNAGSG